MSRDHSAAKKFRDVVRSIARSEIEKMLPADRYAQVHEIHEDTRRVVVQYNGEGEDNLVTLPYNAVKPAYVGQWVRVGGAAGDRHIVDTLGGAAVEARAEEVLEQTPLPTRWDRPDMRNLETMPTWLLADPDPANPTQPNVDIPNGAIAGTVIRVPSKVTVTGVRYRNDTNRSSGHLRILLYEMTPNFDANLISQSGQMSGASGAFTAELESQVTLERGTNILVALHNRTGSSLGIRGRVHYQQYFSDPRDAASYQSTGHTEVPQTIFDNQWTSRYLNASWWHTVILGA